ncbi:hypothetical protein CTAYLR_005308 [Chrysophaeum taylorii]|uniref:Uncharacterized protein n=1 Tax=Chrysophaeum taylorii TaxID=2483200 RepID=A0AAD7XPJ8_9STRA|nr:hypothetical protein CTAYLR_005308 [Chrysophaeum taylorii]
MSDIVLGRADESQTRSARAHSTPPHPTEKRNSTSTQISGKGKLERCVYTNDALPTDGDGALREDEALVLKNSCRRARNDGCLPASDNNRAAPPYSIDALLNLKRKSTHERPGDKRSGAILSADDDEGGEATNQQRAPRTKSRQAAAAKPTAKPPLSAAHPAGSRREGGSRADAASQAHPSDREGFSKKDANLKRPRSEPILGQPEPDLASTDDDVFDCDYVALLSDEAVLAAITSDLAHPEELSSEDAVAPFAAAIHQLSAQRDQRLRRFLSFPSSNGDRDALPKPEAVHEPPVVPKNAELSIEARSKALSGGHFLPPDQPQRPASSIAAFEPSSLSQRRRDVRVDGTQHRDYSYLRRQRDVVGASSNKLGVVERPPRLASSDLTFGDASLLFTEAPTPTHASSSKITSQARPTQHQQQHHHIVPTRSSLSDNTESFRPLQPPLQPNAEQRRHQSKSQSTLGGLPYPPLIHTHHLYPAHEFFVVNIPRRSKAGPLSSSK